MANQIGLNAPHCSAQLTHPNFRALNLFLSTPPYSPNRPHHLPSPPATQAPTCHLQRTKPPPSAFPPTQSPLQPLLATASPNPQPVCRHPPSKILNTPPQTYGSPRVIATSTTVLVALILAPATSRRTLLPSPFRQPLVGGWMATMRGGSRRVVTLEERSPRRWWRSWGGGTTAAAAAVASMGE
ncbi:hypothetical protein Acr_18g0006890 [Actinidia rufa]|uniref:Uncharacterized protein n=1 Tax=Actinidia rufa TaxID=165716 RepID=A0A7J0G6X3_9ERIC|nr:hypothetical protein Acr_18g0006890 [Actinidia rufa]